MKMHRNVNTYSNNNDLSSKTDESAFQCRHIFLTILERVSSILCAVSVGGGLVAAAVVLPSLLSSTGRVFFAGCGVDPG